MRSLPLALILLSACSTPHPAGGGGDDDDSNVDAATSSSDAPALAVDASIDGSTMTPIDAPLPPPITVLRGVDRASAFSMTEASTLKNSDGVKWTGVYIGGPCDAGSGWTKALLTTFANQLDWTFMPIYVGQQKAAICGRDTLTATQGTTDGNAAVALMATFGWVAHRNIPVCLDLEAGTYAANAAGSLAYAKAWRNAVRTGGYLAYIYSNPDGINGLYDAGATFDGAWPASWFYTNFASVSPSDLDQLGTRYTNKNRAWQYASFSATGVGGVDADTSDLLLAPAPGGTNL
jgi:hypothetical protein